MIRKIVVVIVVLAAIWAMPSGRTKLTEFLQPVLKHMGPVGEKMSRPLKKYMAKAQINGILAAIEAAHNEGKEVPDTRTWIHWLRAHPPGDDKELDPWGTPFYMHKVEASYQIGSAGPDRVRYNVDDIYEVVKF